MRNLSCDDLTLIEEGWCWGNLLLTTSFVWILDLLWRMRRGGRFKYGKMRWPSHQKKNFFMNNSVGLSMCDCPIETLKYIWANIRCILDWILSQNSWNILPLHTAHSGSWTTRSGECKNSKRCCPRPIACSQRWRTCLPERRI